MTLELSLSMNCSKRCWYCPQNKIVLNYDGPKFITLFTLYKIVEQKDDIDEISIAGFAEPFDHPDIIEILQMLSEHFAVTVNTVFADVTVTQCLRLMGTGIKKLKIHQTKYLNKELLQEYKDQFMEHFELQIDPVLTEKTIITRSGNLPGGKQEMLKPFKGTLKCYRNFQQPVLIPNGDVHICCMDFSLQNKIGNIHEQTIKEIMSSPQLNNIIRATRTQDQDCICRHCDMPRVQPEGISETILKRFGGL